MTYKKIVHIISFFFISISFFAQTSGKIKYTASFDASVIKNDISSKKLDSTPEKKEALLKFISNLKTVEYELRFNKKHSIYKKIETMETDNGEINITKILAGNSVIYTDLNSDTLIKEQVAFGKVYLIEENLKENDWKLVNESKKIGKYLCFKAERTLKIVNTKGVFYKKVIAWYTPEIPFRFGPSSYCDLPGLILELSEGKLIYKAVDITFSNKEVQIKKLDKGEKVTSKEFEKIGLDLIKSLRN